MKRSRGERQEVAADPLPYCNKRRREARILAGVGVPESGIAEFFGVSMATLEAWKRDHPEFEASIRSGQRALLRGRGLGPRWRQEALAMLEKRAAREAALAESSAQGQNAGPAVALRLACEKGSAAAARHVGVFRRFTRARARASLRSNSREG